MTTALPANSTAPTIAPNVAPGPPVSGAATNGAPTASASRVRAATMRLARCRRSKSPTASAARTAGSLRSISGSLIATSQDRDEDREPREPAEHRACADALLVRGGERGGVGRAVEPHDALAPHV